MGLFDRFKKKTPAAPEQPETGTMYVYSEEELREYEDFLSSRYGKFDRIFHEIVSPDIHLDVIVIHPTKEHPFYKLITMGMGAYRMQVPGELREYELERAELVTYLPADWQVYSDKEWDYWPIRWMKILARYPLEAETWLGLGHTVSTSAEDDAVAENAGFTGFLLLNALGLDREPLDFRLPSGERVNFYQMLPLYPEEVCFKLEHGIEALMERFGEEDRFPVINIHRKSYGPEKQP